VTVSQVVSTLRARSDTIRLVPPGAPGITIRAQVAEAWDAVRLEVSAAATVSTVKHHALLVIDPGGEAADCYAVKFKGIEVLDEDMTLADAGVVDGSTLLLLLRHRRAVR
jgi:hypothetical protein